MSDQLYMNVDAANQALMEMKEYKEEKGHNFAENIAKPAIAAYEAKPWVANSYKEFCNLMSEQYDIKSRQDAFFDSLMEKLQKEIRQWEETSHRLGS